MFYDDIDEVFIISFENKAKKKKETFRETRPCVIFSMFIFINHSSEIFT